MMFDDATSQMRRRGAGRLKGAYRVTPLRFGRLGLAGIATAACLGVVASSATAQGVAPPYPSQAPAAKQPAPPPAKQQTKRTPPPTGEGAATTSDSSLRQRLEQVEEQLVDLQVAVGTVESMTRSSGPASGSTAYRGGAPMGGSGADIGRINALETQVQALTSQLDQLTSQLRALQGTTPRGPSGPAPRAGGGGFGTTTVVPPNDPIANLINTPEPRDTPAQRASSPQPPLPSSLAGRQQYDQAYALLLQGNYSAAEAGFAEFLQRFPSDDLASNAQFWLGETFFVRNQWDSAAASFLKVAQNYPRADKAPDSLAKFAMAMERKGNRSGACRALQELNTRYPNPPAHVRTWETTERRRAGCT